MQFQQKKKRSTRKDDLVTEEHDDAAEKKDAAQVEEDGVIAGKKDSATDDAVLAKTHFMFQIEKHDEHSWLLFQSKVSTVFIVTHVCLIVHSLFYSKR